MPTSIQLIKGIGPAAARQLAQLGFNSAEDLALASIEDLLATSGFGEARARQVIKDAAQLASAQNPPKASIYATGDDSAESLTPVGFDDGDEDADDDEDFGDDSEIDEFEDAIEDDFFDGPSAAAPDELKAAEQKDGKQRDGKKGKDKKRRRKKSKKNKKDKKDKKDKKYK